MHGSEPVSPARTFVFVSIVGHESGQIYAEARRLPRVDRVGIGDIVVRGIYLPPTCICI